MCGGATTCTEQPVSGDADLLYRIIGAEGEKRDIFAHFERYHGEREQDRRAA
jgi:hypothetical protein